MSGWSLQEAVKHPLNVLERVSPEVLDPPFLPVPTTPQLFSLSVYGLLSQRKGGITVRLRSKKRRSFSTLGVIVKQNKTLHSFKNRNSPLKGCSYSAYKPSNGCSNQRFGHMNEFKGTTSNFSHISHEPQCAWARNVNKWLSLMEASRVIN